MDSSVVAGYRCMHGTGTCDTRSPIADILLSPSASRMPSIRYDSRPSHSLLRRKPGGVDDGFILKDLEVLGQTTHFVVVFEREAMAPEADERTKTYKRGRVAGTAVLFEKTRALCAIPFDVETPNEMRIGERSVGGMATDDLLASLRADAAKIIGTRIAELTDGRVAGAVE